MVCCQGADTVIYERLDPSNKLNEHLKQVTREHMEMYGGAGLRTLCLACVELDPAVYDAWVLQPPAWPFSKSVQQL
jgi:phospholipid-transporting ATPase